MARKSPPNTSARRVVHNTPRQSDAVRKQTVHPVGTKRGFGASQSPKSGPKVTTRKPRSTG